MNVKRTFGVILTLLGIVGLVYAAWLYLNSGEAPLRDLAVYGVLGAIFFFTGVGLIKRTSDDVRPPVR